MSEEAAPDEIPAPRKLTVASLGATPALTALVGIAWISNQAYQEGFALEQHLFGFGVLVWVMGLTFAVAVSIVVAFVGILALTPKTGRQRFLQAAGVSSMLGLIGAFGSFCTTFGPYEKGTHAGYRALELAPYQEAAESLRAWLKEQPEPRQQRGRVFDPDAKGWQEAPAKLRELPRKIAQAAVGPKGVTICLQGGYKQPYAGLYFPAEGQGPPQDPGIETFPLAEGVHYVSIRKRYTDSSELVGAKGLE
ncbi:MAG TPA: hypothetical protein DEA08_20400 [Planctomycetes bacterium]|nr:hypothetical protein [Planctomycetota bacterium]